MSDNEAEFKTTLEAMPREQLEHLFIEALSTIDALILVQRWAASQPDGGAAAIEASTIRASAFSASVRKRLGVRSLLQMAEDPTVMGAVEAGFEAANAREEDR